jgi:YidC/Oxa1 family membrane protein insertase
MNIFEVLLLQPLANGLVIFYKVLGGNMGLAIIGFSLFLRVVLNPLTKPYMESMKKMREYGPELEKIKNKHKNDKAKQIQAQSEFYKEKGINPGAGCLPYLLQIVVLIAFFNVFRKVLGGGDIVANFNELLYAPLQFAKDAVINTKFLYIDITQPDTLDLGLPFPFPGPFLILAALVQFLSAKISQPYVEVEEAMAKKTPEKEDDIQAAMQQSMIYTFPLFTLFIGIRFQSGLVLYWLLFSFYQAFQQYSTSGWGGLTPWLKKLGLLKSESKKK